MNGLYKLRLKVFFILLAYIFLLVSIVFLFKLRVKDPRHLFGSTYMTMNNPYFKVLNDNLRDVVEANGDILITRDPAQNQTRQNEQIINMLDEGAELLFINAVDKGEIEPALYECEKRGVPVILLDTDVDKRVGVISTIQSDNYKAGVLLAGDLMKKRPQGAKILIVSNLIAASMVQRRQGFIDTVSQNNIYEIVDEIDGVSEIETVNEAMNEYLKTRHKEIDVVFGLNDPTAIGALAALNEKSDSSPLIYGVDGSPGAKGLIKQGTFTATAAQHPISMGKRAAKIAYDYIKGQDIEKDIYIDVDLINAGNIANTDTSKWQ